MRQKHLPNHFLASVRVRLPRCSLRRNLHETHEFKLAGRVSFPPTSYFCVSPGLEVMPPVYQVSIIINQNKTIHHILGELRGHPVIDEIMWLHLLLL